MARTKTRHRSKETASSESEYSKSEFFAAWGADDSESAAPRTSQLEPEKFISEEVTSPLKPYLNKTLLRLLLVWDVATIVILFASATIEGFYLSNVVLATVAGGTILLTAVIVFLFSKHLFAEIDHPGASFTEDVSLTTENLPATAHRALALIREVEHLRNLEDNWNTYGGKAPSETAINNAVFALVEGAEGTEVLPDYMDPSNDESIIFTYQRDQDQYLLEFYNDGDIVFLKHDGDTTPTTSEITHDDLGKALREIGGGSRHALQRTGNSSKSAHER